MMSGSINPRSWTDVWQQESYSLTGFVTLSILRWPIVCDIESKIDEIQSSCPSVVAKVIFHVNLCNKAEELAGKMGGKNLNIWSSCVHFSDV